MTTGIKRVLKVCCDFIMPAGVCTHGYITRHYGAFMLGPSCVWTDASLSGRRDRGAASGCTGSVQSKRLQVFNSWSEIQQMEEDVTEKLVSTATTMAAERRIRDLKVLGDKLDKHNS